MSLIANGAGEQPTGFYNNVIGQSLRLSVGSDYKLDRQMVTPTSVTGTICTASWWMKKSAHGTVQSFIQCRDNQASGNYNAYWSYDSGFGANDHHAFFNEVDSINLGTNTTVMPYRDPTSWYHVVIRYDSTQGTAANRIRIYINGVNQVSTFSTTTYPSQNAVNTYWNNVGEHLILFGNGEDSGDSFDGYVAEFNWVDGLSLAPESFGESKNGVWIPKKYTGAYGLNGSRYTFADSSDIGKDTSGVGNDLDRVSNLAASDVVPDSPENNFCTINSVINSTGTIAQSEGNLRSTQSGTTSSFMLGTIPFRSGKWWMEVRVNAFNDNYAPLVIRTDISQNSDGSNNNILDAAAGAVGMYQNGEGFVDGSSIGNGTFAPSGHDGNDVGDVIGVAVDLDSGTPTIKFFLDGTQTSITQNLPASMLNTDLVFGCLQYNGNTLHFNWGQDSTFGGSETATTNADDNGIGEFHHAPPSGYLALCSANLPEPTIGPNSGTQADDHFDTLLHTADGSAGAFTGADFQPDWIWAKNRTNAYSHELWDSSRGVNSDLQSDNANAEITDTGRLVSFDSGGFSYGTSSNLYVNNTASVAWLWKANGGTATATISESGNNPAAVVQANPTAGFSIITYTGTGDTGTIAHGLGAVPTWILIKNRDQADSWAVYHGGNTSAPATDYLKLDTNAVTADGVGWWDDTAPTSSVFTVHDQHMVNADGEKYVAYVFADVEGYSKFGSYISNANVDGTFIYLGFRPKFVIVKRTNATYSWMMYDDKRDTSNVMNTTFFADLNNAESASDNIDFVSNGIKLRTTGNSFNGGAGSLFVYMAWAEVPFKYANAR